MKKIAEALVYAVNFIDIRLDSTEEHLDDDVDALESIAGILHESSEDEKDALASAADRLLEAERSLPTPRPEWIQAYENWMEEMFIEGWQGNKRI
jgi:hypothetical protein